MARFFDKAQREWTVELDVPAIDRVSKQADGFRIDRMLADHAAGLKHLLGDTILFVRVLWLLVEEQAEKFKISPEQFGRSVGGGDALEDAATAFLEALADFSPRHLRKLLRAGMAKTAETAERKLQRALAKIAADETERPESPTPPTSSGSPTNSPASSASTPAVEG